MRQILILQFSDVAQRGLITLQSHTARKGRAGT